jgi:gamma-glutamylcysteine synthetase
MLEISLARSRNLALVAAQLDAYLICIQDHLRERNHILSGFGVHPFARHIDRSPIDITHYRMLNRFMRLREARDPFYDIDFFAIINAVQTHVDCALADVPRIFDLFSRLDWVNAALFSNSILLDAGVPQHPFIGCRDLYYRASALGERASNVGTFDRSFAQIEDVCGAMSECAIWYVVDGEDYIFFKPVPLAEFFRRPNIHCSVMDGGFRVHDHVLIPEEAHIAHFKGFKHVTLSKHRTIEIRSTCQQPLSEVLAPVAFVIGCVAAIDEIEDILAADNLPLSNGERRNAVILNRAGDVAPPARFGALVRGVTTAAFQGLERRRQGEERFLEPALARAERLASPAADALSDLGGAVPLRQLIERRAQWSWHRPGLPRYDLPQART